MFDTLNEFGRYLGFQGSLKHLLKQAEGTAAVCFREAVRAIRNQGTETAAVLHADGFADSCNILFSDLSTKAREESIEVLSV